MRISMRRLAIQFNLIKTDVLFILNSVNVIDKVHS
jgi:hypothetical protein